MIGIIDYGVGNLFSLKASLKYIGAKTTLVKTREDIMKVDKIILPGVGAFEDAIEKLRDSKLSSAVIDEGRQGKPLLGICLGMQLLFENSFEYGEHKGLSLIKGDVASIREDLDKEKNKELEELKVPHIGWNKLIIQDEDPLFKYIKKDEYMYYVHSYYGKRCYESTIAYSNYGIKITGVVKSGNVYGTQFHPEKSGTSGLNILKAFEEL